MFLSANKYNEIKNKWYNLSLTKKIYWTAGLQVNSQLLKIDVFSKIV